MGRKAKGIRYNAGCIFRKVSQNNQPEIPPIKAVTSDPISGTLKNCIINWEQIVANPPIVLGIEQENLLLFPVKEGCFLSGL